MEVAADPSYTVLSVLVQLAPDGQPRAVTTRLGDETLTCAAYQIAAWAGGVVVGDQCTKRITVVGTDGQLRAAWGEPGQGRGQFSDITSMAVAPDGSALYIADRETRRLTQWSLDGTLLHEWTSSAATFASLVALDVDAAGTLYGLDESRAQVIRLTADGTLQAIPLAKESGAPFALAVRPAGDGFYLLGDAELSLIAADGHYEGIGLSGCHRCQLAVAPDGRLLVTGDGTRLMAYEAPR